VRVLRLIAAALLVSACTGAPATTGPSATPPSATPTLSPTQAPTLSPSPTASAVANPRGSAINGSILYSDKGDIFALDPATGESTLLVGGPTNDFAPTVMRDGVRFLFVREEDAGIYTAALDGTGVKRWADANVISSSDESPDGRFVAIPDGGGDLIVWDGGAGPMKHLGLKVPANNPRWIDNETLLLVQEVDGFARKYWVEKADGTGLRPLAAPDACCEQSIDTSTRRLAYADFVFQGARTSSSVHIIDFTTGVDTILASTVAAQTNYVDPRFSPDGKWIVAEQFPPGGGAHRSVLIASDGSGAPIQLGPNPSTNMLVGYTFSPDSTRLLITREDGVYLFSIPDGAGGRVDWNLGGLQENPPSWERLPG